MHWFGEPKHSVNYLVFQRDKGISRKSYKKLVRGAIRLPIAFLRLNTMLKGKKQRKVALIMKLAISNFSCPAETHITNFTRLPLRLKVLPDHPIFVEQDVGLNLVVLFCDEFYRGFDFGPVFLPGPAFSAGVNHIGDASDRFLWYSCGLQYPLHS